jgi:signal transduction histidine kinase
VSSVIRWFTRVTDDRFTWLRLTLLALSGIGFLVLRPGHDEPYATVDWVAAIGALALCPVAVRWPLAGSLGCSVAYLAGGCFGSGDPVVPEVGAAWMLLELALRRPYRQVWTGAAGVVVGHVVDVFPHLPGAFPSLLFDLLITSGLPLLMGANIRASRQLARQAEHRATAEAVAARAGERAAIARELHDLVAHHVASMVLRVGVARHVLTDTDPRVGDVFDDLHATGTTALTDLRRLVALLRNPAADASAYVPIDPGALPDALATTVDRATRAGLTVDATIDPAVASLDAVRGLAVLRLTQEGLTNVAKHAGPSARATLAVTVRADAVHWEITDDGGRAGDAALRPANGEPGHGLVGMRERVEVLGGTLTAGPYGTGWRLATVLPAPLDAPAAVGARADR